MDFLDIEVGKYYKTFSGLYYETQPEFAINGFAYEVDAVNDTDNNEESTEFESGKHFNYEYVGYKEKRYQMLFGNVENSNDNFNATIKTMQELDWKVGAFVTLEDGTFYSIDSVAKDYESMDKEVSQIFGNPVGVEYVIRLVSRANPFKRDNI